MTMTGSGITVTPRETEIGAEVDGTDLSQPLSPDVVDTIRTAFDAHRVLVFRNQTLGVERQIEFSRNFGNLEDFPSPTDQAEGFPMVLRVTNIDKETGSIKPVDDPAHKSFTLGTGDWHIDSSFRRIPSKASMLHVIEVPASGGDTMFADTSLAYDALPDTRKRQIDGLFVIHDFEIARRRHNLPPRAAEIRAALPPVRQPLVARLANGRRALFMGSHASGIEGMSPAAGEALLAELTAFATNPPFVCRHNWNAGDMVMFDNICVMHRAMPYDLERDRRLLHRTTIAGDAPLEGFGGTL